MAILTDVNAVKQVLATHKRVAVIGAHKKEHKAAYYVPHYMQQEGYEVFPVNPAFKGEQLFNRSVVATLNDLNEDVDIVNVFRRSDALGEHVDDILSMRVKPAVVWFQLGIQNDAVAQTLSDAGIDVIQNRCMLADHQRLF